MKMKRVVAFALTVMLLLSVVPSVFAVSDTAIKSADALHSLGLFEGVGTDASGNPNYALDRAPTRAEAITMLVRLLGKEAEAKAKTWTTPFTDVPNWAKPYVGYAYDNKLTMGTGEKFFGSSSKVSATQYLTFVLRALGYESGTDFQWNKAWELTDKIGITSGEYNAKSTTFLRGDVVTISFAALSAATKGENGTLIQNLVKNNAVDGNTAESFGLDAYGLLNNIKYVYDIRTFTLYAFANYTGYDDNNGYVISGVRKQLRDDLFAMDISISNPDYLANKKNFRFDKILDVLGDAPSFRYISAPDLPSEYLDLPQRLAEFYNAADIPALYEKYRPYYETLLQKYQLQVTSPLIRSISFLRAKEYIPDAFIFEANLLEAYERGNVRKADSNIHDGSAIIRSGPTTLNGGVNALNVVHEYYHLVTDPILSTCSSQINAISGYHDKTPSVASQQGYVTWDEIVRESVVRAISTYFVYGPDSGIVADETRKGFTLTSYISQRIPEMGTFSGTFAEFIKMLLIEYPQYV